MPAAVEDQHNWNHPRCLNCWELEWKGNRIPHCIKNAPLEVCCWCGQYTRSGIYVRLKPGSFEIPHCTDTVMR